MLPERTHDGRHCLHCGRNVRPFILLTGLTPARVYVRCPGCKVNLIHPAIPTWWSILVYAVFYFVGMNSIRIMMEQRIGWGGWFVFLLVWWLVGEAVLRLWAWFLIWRWDWYHNEVSSSKRNSHLPFTDS